MTDDVTARFLIDREEALLSPDTRASATELDGLLDKDFLEFGRSGGVYDREAIIAALTSEVDGRRCRRRTMDRAQVRFVASDVALLTYRSTRQGTDGDTLTTLRSSLWVKRDGVWRMTFHQGTPTAPQP
jgi:glyoxylase I family protein